MPEITRTYRLDMMTLSPLHVGTGRELLLDYDYVVRQGRTWRIDEDALLDASLGDAEFDDSLLRRPAAELLRPGEFRPDSVLFRYVIPGAPRASESGAHLREQIKDAFDRPYLPGSSLKGALRTALFDWAISKQPQVLDVGRLDNRRRWAAQPVERAALGRDPNHDLLRALQVADSVPLEAGPSLGIENAQVLTAGGSGSPIEVEALRPQVRLRTTVKLDMALFGPQAERELRLGSQLAWLERLMAVCRARAKPILEAERAWFAGNYPRSRVAAFYGELCGLADGLGETRCLLNVGWGGGWLNKTVGLRLDERGREEVISRYRLARGRRQWGDPFPKSRRVAVDSQGRPAAPFGWLLVQMRPEARA